MASKAETKRQLDLALIEVSALKRKMSDMESAFCWVVENSMMCPPLYLTTRCNGDPSDKQECVACWKAAAQKELKKHE